MLTIRRVRKSAHHSLHGYARAISLYIASIVKSSSLLMVIDCDFLADRDDVIAMRLSIGMPMSRHILLS